MHRYTRFSFLGERRLTCEVTATQALRPGTAATLGSWAGACGPLELPFAKRGCLNFSPPFFRKAVGSHPAGGCGGQLLGEAPLGLCGETGNMRGKRRKRVGPSFSDQRRRPRVGAGWCGASSSEDCGAARSPRRQACWRRCKRRSPGTDWAPPGSSEQNSGRRIEPA